MCQLRGRLLTRCEKGRLQKWAAFSFCTLEGLVLEVEPLAGEGMAEGEAFGVEIEAVGTRSVEDVALDGTSETVGMGAMDAELVGATCLRV